MKPNRIYERLKDHPYFEDKMEFNEAKDCLTIVFHEYFCLDYFEGDYATAGDEGLLHRSSCAPLAHILYTQHWHITDDDEILDILMDFSGSDDIFIENTRFFALVAFRQMKKERFQKNKSRLMAKKHLRIYSAQEIFKRSSN